MNAMHPPGSFKIDPTRGTMSTAVSSQWWSRPEDQRFLDLNSLYDAVDRRRRIADVRSVSADKIRLETSRTDPDKISLYLPQEQNPVEPTNWSFGQLCSLVQAPAGYLRDLPATLAAINLQHGLVSDRRELIKTMTFDDGRPELRCATSETYGRVWDAELVEAIQRIAGNGVGDTRWKVPGQIDWSSMRYNPHVDITKDTTTLYASDRDVFVFLVDDQNPIEAGRLPNGDPDYYFRGFYAWNSEVGSRALGIATFYLRGVCQNRCIWGMEQFEQLRIRHTKFAGSRFSAQAAPALEHFANSSPQGFVRGIKAAREAVVARTDDERRDFLIGRGFGARETREIIETVVREEGRPPESILDFVQGITARARSVPQQDARLDQEKRAQALMSRVSA
ncbi:DUF932 domain-containing protein [Asticcacaulis sp.]|uniref:DUF932 domain-containing protein n=1 Tax=Asticcacaulis sp. TaxID=1872648 RepID=UPI002609BEB8|nr:DUF932 domain-containing protein [Asticcacaulis sp.]